MARCQRCNKFMLLKPATGYCKDCDALNAAERKHKAEEERKRKEDEDKAKKQRMVDEETLINSGDPMKYSKAVQNNSDLISSRMMRDMKSSTLLFGTEPVSFYPVRAVMLNTVTEKPHTFHVIGLLHLGVGNDIILCAEIRTGKRIDLFWVGAKGRISFNSDDAAPFNYALNELVSFDDGNFDAMVKYVLATWSMDSKSH